MDWLTENVSHTVASISNAYEVLRQNAVKPAPGNDKFGNRKLKNGSNVSNHQEDSQLGCCIKDEDLAAFPPLSKQEGIECRRARLVAYHSTSAVLKEKYQGFCEEFNNQLFEKLWHEFLIHQDPLSMRQQQRGLPPMGLPAAVLSARGIGGEADTMDMYQSLVQYLQGRKAYTALLQPKDLAAGVGGALRLVLQQLRGPEAQDWGANDIEALYAWYADQTAPPASMQQAPPAAAAAGAAAGAAAAAAAGGVDDEKKPERRQTRQGKTQAPPKGKGAKAQQQQQAPIADIFAAAKETNRRRALVVVVQAADQAEVAPLRDLVTLLMQEHARFPVCLLLGVSSPADLLTSSLSADLLGRLHLRAFHLPPQHARLQTFFQDVILSSNSAQDTLPLLLSSPPMQLLLGRFHTTDGSISSLSMALDQAAMEHCMASPLSALAAVAMTADRTAVAAAAAQLPQDVVAAAASKFEGVGSAVGGGAPYAADKSRDGMAGPKNRGSAVARGVADSGEVTGPVSAQLQTVVEAVADAGAAWANWRLGLLWTHKIAETTGASSRPEFQLPALYTAAARPSFLQARPAVDARTAPKPLGQQLIGQLTGLGNSCSITSLVKHEDGLRCMLDELLHMGEDAIEAWPSVHLIRQVTEDLRQLVDAEVELEGQELAAAHRQQKLAAGAPGSSVAAPEQAGSSTQAAAAAARQQPPGSTEPAAGEAGVGSLVSPVRKALEGVNLLSPKQAAGMQQQQQGARQQPKGPTTMLTAAARKQARSAAMLQAAQAGAAGRAGAARQLEAELPAAAAVVKQRTLQEKAAGFLAGALKQLLGSCPFAMPGACAFAYSRTMELESMLTFAPRAAVHEALLRPHVFLGGPEQDVGAGLEDPALAYRLLLGQDNIDVGQWFVEFCSLSGVGANGKQCRGNRKGGENAEAREGDVDEEDGDEEMCGARGRGKGRSGRRRGRRLSPDGEPAARGRGTKKVQQGEDDEVGGPALTEEEQEAQALALAAHFSQAVAELQWVGLCRPSKRRKQSSMQRLYYPPERLL